MVISIIFGAVVGFFIWQITKAESPEKRHEWPTAGAIVMVFCIIVVDGASVIGSLVGQATNENQRVWVKMTEDDTWKRKQKAKSTQSPDWELEAITATPTACPTKVPEQRPTKDPQQRPNASVGGAKPSATTIRRSPWTLYLLPRLPPMTAPTAVSTAAVRPIEYCGTTADPLALP